MGKLGKFIAGQPGYFREGEEESFPWDCTDRCVWYSLFVVEGNKIERYGFTSSQSNKQGLCDALNSLSNVESALLLGVWTGQYYTSLFVLPIPKAIKLLRASLSGGDPGSDGT